MEITLTKTYGCVICPEGEIVHQTTENTYEGEVPDQSNCDFSTYCDPKVSGGKLLRTRLRAETERVFFENQPQKAKKRLPLGGICENCLKNEIVKRLLAIKAINLDENPGTFRAYE